MQFVNVSWRLFDDNKFIKAEQKVKTKDRDRIQIYD